MCFYAITIITIIKIIKLYNKNKVKIRLVLQSTKFNQKYSIKMFAILGNSYVKVANSCVEFGKVVVKNSQGTSAKFAY